jgi:hypothetical protein
MILAKKKKKKKERRKKRKVPKEKKEERKKEKEKETPYSPPFWRCFLIAEHHLIAIHQSRVSGYPNRREVTDHRAGVALTALQADAKAGRIFAGKD